MARTGIGFVVALMLALQIPASAQEASVPVLTYHRLGLSADGETTVSDATFEWQLRYLKENGYSVIPLRLLVDHYRGLAPRLPPRPVVITVDDGHQSVYTRMLPIVRRYGVPVTLFVYPSAVSNASYAMTWEQLRELRKSGLFEVQSHTYWHPNFKTERRRLTTSDFETLVTAQLAKSKAVLESQLQGEVDLLAWPFGIADDDLMKKASQAGYIAGFALGNRQASARDPLMALPRFMVTEAYRGAFFERVVQPQARVTADPEYSGTVVDAVTGNAVADATVTVGGSIVRTAANGKFSVNGEGSLLRVRAPGYARRDVTAASAAPLRVALTPFLPKAAYLSFYGIASEAIREPALRLIDKTELNAVVIDVKGDRGLISIPSAIPLAVQAGAQRRTTIKDPKALIDSLKARGIYTIARIVVFKDEPLAAARPDLAVKAADGAVWRDREHLAWTDPFQSEVWDYNIDIAVQAASVGFDEIQFDYFRFPDAAGLRYSAANHQQNRIGALTGFLQRTGRRLAPYNVFVAADVFGYVCWNLNDTNIGQRLEEFAPLLDYFSPMLYPSGFQFGIPGYRNPVANPDAIVGLSLKQARERTGLSALRFRPWLQAFRDYAFDHRDFDGDEIRSQIDAAEGFGSAGWMLWDPRNVYSEDALKR